MSVDPKNAAKLSDLSRLMFDEPPAEQKPAPVKSGAWSGGMTPDSILDDLARAMERTVAVPPEYLWGTTTPASREDEEQWFSRQLRGARYDRYIVDDPFGMEPDPRRRGTAADIMRAAYNVRGIERVQLEMLRPGRLNVHIAQVSRDADNIHDYRRRLEHPVLQAVNAVVAAGVDARVYVHTPLMLFSAAVDSALNEFRRRYVGLRVTSEAANEVASQLRLWTTQTLVNSQTRSMLHPGLGDEVSANVIIGSSGNLLQHARIHTRYIDRTYVRNVTLIY